MDGRLKAVLESRLDKGLLQRLAGPYNEPLMTEVLDRLEEVLGLRTYEVSEVIYVGKGEAKRLAAELRAKLREAIVGQTGCQVEYEPAGRDCFGPGLRITVRAVVVTRLPSFESEEAAHGRPPA